MKVCVIGGAGYIGSHAVYELLKDNNEVIVIDNLSTSKKMLNKNVKFYSCNITNKRKMLTIFKNECLIRKFDIIMLFAAKSSIPESFEDPLTYYYNNVEGVRIVLEMMKNFNIKNIVFSSSAAVYGEWKNKSYKESDLTKPINPYGSTKLASEEMIKWVCQTYNFNYCIFRYFNVAGANNKYLKEIKHDDLRHLIPITIENALNNKKVLIYGDDYKTEDGTCIRDYIHVTDLVNAHILGAKYIINNNKSLLLNLGSNKGYSVKEIISEISNIKKINYKIVARRNGDPDKLVALNKKAKKVLNWKIKYKLSDMIKTDMNYRKK